MYLLWFHNNSLSKLKSPSSDIDPVSFCGQLKRRGVILADIFLCCRFARCVALFLRFLFLTKDFVDRVGDKVATLKTCGDKSSIKEANVWVREMGRE